MRALAFTFALLLAGGPALAQEPSPDPELGPSADPELGPSPDPREAILRERNGELIARLVERTTQPSEEWARLSIEVLKDRSPIDRTRRFDLSWRRSPGGRVSLRLRFLEPPALRGVAWLILEPEASPPRAHRYDPKERRSSRVSPPDWSQRLAGTGLTWGDLRGPAQDAFSYTLQGEERLKLRPTAEGEVGFRPVHVLGVRPRGGGPLMQRVHVDRERRVPLLTEFLGPEGGPGKRRWDRSYERVGDRLRPVAITIVEEAQTSEVRAELIKAKAPPAHFDVDRYWQE